MFMKELNYAFYTTREIKPTGWLKKQLEIQAAGLAGNLDKVWPDVRDSAWIGGDREGWERVPYWLDGFIPLAYLLDDQDMKNRADYYMNAIMDAQQEDGWLCPCKPEKRRTYDTWATLLIGKVLTVYIDCVGEDTPQGQKATGVLSRMLRQFNGFLNGTTLHDWGACRWFEGVIPALWLYERTGEEWLLQLCQKLRAQGVNWRQVMEAGLWESLTTGWDYLTHVVNVAMMLKSEALMSRITGEDPDDFATKALDRLLTYHGMACGHFSGDECLAGTSPIHGTELCGIVEAMYSYEHLFSLTGNPRWLDQLEITAYNALPAAVSPDMWTHQYDQLTNQIQCTPIDASILRANGPDAICFGLEPNFGCCTANFGQGFPKFSLSTFMKAPDGIASCALAPATLTTSINGVGVTCELETEYPFRDTLIYRIKVDRPVTFTFYHHIPDAISYAAVDHELVETRGMHAIRRRFEGETVISVELTAYPTFKARSEGLYTLWCGQLLFALPIGEQWEKVEYEANGVSRTYPYCDYHITPTTPWQYGFSQIDMKNLCAFKDYDAPFSTDQPPLCIRALMAPISWQAEGGHCKKLPDEPVAVGEEQWLELIPYGCTQLRIAETYKVSPYQGTITNPDLEDAWW